MGRAARPAPFFLIHSTFHDHQKRRTVPLRSAGLCPAARQAPRSSSTTCTASTTVADPQISPDGKWVAYTVGSVDVAADKSDTDIWMTSWDGTQHLRLTTSPDAETAPRWSPDGRYLVVHLQPSRGRPRATRSGCWTATAVRRSSSPISRAGSAATNGRPIRRSCWSRIADPDPNSPTSAAAAAAAAARRECARAEADRHRSLQVQAGHPGLPDAARAARLPVRHRDQETGRAAESSVEAASPSWSPDGQRVAFLARSGKDADRYNTSNVFVVERGRAPRRSNSPATTASPPARRAAGRSGARTASSWRTCKAPARNRARTT